MAPESMVHALEIIWKLLKPDSHLLDIHPSGIPPQIILRIDSENHMLGNLQESDDFIEYSQASEAIQAIIQVGLFQLECSSQFNFVIHADTIPALVDFLKKEWKDSILAPEIIALADTLWQQFGAEKEILVSELDWMTLLRPERK